MAKDKKSTFPGSLRERKDAAKSESVRVGAKIDDALEKLAGKFRNRAEKAKAKIADTKKPEKQAALSQRFELYEDVARYLEKRVSRDKN